MFINNFDPVAFQIFSIEIRWYSLAYIVGISLGWILGKKFFISDSNFLIKTVVSTFFLLLGGFRCLSCGCQLEPLFVIGAWEGKSFWKNKKNVKNLCKLRWQVSICRQYDLIRQHYFVRKSLFCVGNKFYQAAFLMP